MKSNNKNNEEEGEEMMDRLFISNKNNTFDFVENNNINNDFVPTTIEEEAKKEIIDYDDEFDINYDSKKKSDKEKEEWMARKEDLEHRRKGFGGAVCYGYGGVFSVQMYGTAEAKDPDTLNPYTVIIYYLLKL